MKAKSSQLYLKEFPGFKLAFDPTQYGLTDTSWHNDVCPSFSVEAEYTDARYGKGTYCAERLWVDFPKKADREIEDHPRFTYELCTHEHSEPLAILLRTEDPKEAEAFLKKRLAERVGVKFVAVLKDWLGDKKFSEVQKRNLADPKAHGEMICHSHDFCDANMAMLRAYSEITGIDEDDIDLEITMPTMNDAWAHAKKNGLIAAGRGR